MRQYLSISVSQWPEMFEMKWKIQEKIQHWQVTVRTIAYRNHLEFLFNISFIRLWHAEHIFMQETSSYTMGFLILFYCHGKTLRWHRTHSVNAIEINSPSNSGLWLNSYIVCKQCVPVLDVPDIIALEYSYSWCCITKIIYIHVEGSKCKVHWNISNSWAFDCSERFSRDE